VDLLVNHPWPGNVRELENALEHAAVMSVGGFITADLLPLGPAVRVAEGRGLPAARPLADVEADHIQAVLQLTGGNRTEAARILQIGEATLYRRLRQLRAEPGPA
jgi:two-component system response regulator HydG